MAQRFFNASNDYNTSDNLPIPNDYKDRTIKALREALVEIFNEADRMITGSSEYNLPAGFAKIRDMAGDAWAGCVPTAIKEKEQFRVDHSDTF